MAFRYDDSIYHFAIICQWYGGKSLLKILNGSVIYGEEGHNKNGINLPIPSKQSIASRLHSVTLLKTSGQPPWSKSVISKENSLIGGFAFDEVDVKQSYVREHKTGIMIGGHK